MQLLDQNCIASFVDAVSLKDAFRQIKADCFDMHFERSCFAALTLSTILGAALAAASTSSPFPRQYWG